MKNLLSLSAAICISAIALAQPIITVQPADQVLCADTCAAFDIAAVGTGMNYFWQIDQGSGFSGVGTNSDNLVFCDSITALDSAVVRCIITDINGDSAISMEAMISIDSCLPPIADFEFYFDYTEVIACFTSTSERAETLIWFFGDGNTTIGNVADTCHDYDTKELYWVKLYAFSSYGSDSIVKKVDILGVDEIEENVSVYPNPASDILNISMDERIERAVVYDIYGKLCLIDNPHSSSVRFDLSNLQRGAFILRLETENDVITRKILKE
ncbi:MAG: T9SS type A sorting domain-containing protein [Flavobacteriales bacterium]|jgi:hypothetical protein|nr:T9SS type A sorting domain-containing protein [Flavobacteriales bacterium]MBT3964848.1 T9SS type A sorting domain-containing protein [Flavobacteriales bacterium]MBT4704364.1 T9SS type A sorting domain-containing protein [Flavobacteriales bacterium]MBT4930480.1 T9SS type A sorting domain-containing protein [Flavobacteriales bacterium]MBT5131756.1 T9SS type A sorting domain-containing protein [Flavobacteriales bacterium]